MTEIRLYEVGKIGNNEFANYRNTIYIPTEDVENIKKAMQLLGLDDMCIIKNGDTILYKHPKITELENKETAEREAYYTAMRATAENLNKEPTNIKTWQFADGYQISIVREGTASLDLKMSAGRLSHCAIRQHFTKDGVDVSNTYYFEASRYISENGKILRKSFLSWHREIPEDVANAIVDKIQEIHDFDKEYRKKWCL